MKKPKKKPIPKSLEGELRIKAPSLPDGVEIIIPYRAFVWYDRAKNIITYDGKIPNNIGGYDGEMRLDGPLDVWAECGGYKLPWEEDRGRGRPRLDGKKAAIYLYSCFLISNGKRKGETNEFLRNAFGYLDVRNIEQIISSVKKEIKWTFHPISEEIYGGYCVGFARIDKADKTERVINITGNFWVWTYPNGTADYFHGQTLNLCDKNGGEIKPCGLTDRFHELVAAATR